MRTTIGCSGLIAAVAFVGFLIVALIATRGNVGEAAGSAVGFGVLTFFVSFLLFCRDYARQRRAVRNVRGRLLARENCDEEDFLGRFTSDQQPIARATRQAIARFFDVPEEKILATDKLDLHLEADVLGLIPQVAFSILGSISTERRIVSIETSKIVDVRDLVASIERAAN